MTKLHSDEIIINMGPQHPSTHGVLHVLLTMDGEIVLKAEPSIGYLHRGVEKLAENKPYLQITPILDRMDYLSGFNNEMAYCMAVEKLLSLGVPERAQYLRVILSELFRINSHLVWVGTFLLDVGAITPFLYTFRERETINLLVEKATGSRMMPNFNRFGGLREDIPEGWVRDCQDFIDDFKKRLVDYNNLITGNEIFLARTKNIGIITEEQALDWSLTGPVLRASGVRFDVRKDKPYLVYDRFDFNIPVGTVGDVFDRYQVRMIEMEESMKIIDQALAGLPEGDYVTRDSKVVAPKKEEVATKMESMIRHFHLGIKAFKPPEGEVYEYIESPRGEFGYYLVSDGGRMPYRMKVRPPALIALSILPELARGMLIADVVAIIGSLDLVLGEIDR